MNDQDTTKQIHEQFNVMINEVINGWMQEADGLPITLTLGKLAIRIYTALQDAYTMGGSDPLAPIPKSGEIIVAPALLLDFDGTIRRSKSGKTFIQGSDDIELFPDVEDKLQDYYEKNWFIAGISNQGGVAYGLRTPEQIAEEMTATLRLFKNSPFAAVKMCLHHEKGSVFPFNHRSLLRKPDIGMLALLELDAFQHGIVIDWNKSMMVGDRFEDQKMAENAGIQFQWADDFFDRVPAQGSGD